MNLPVQDDLEDPLRIRLRFTGKRDFSNSKRDRDLENER